MMKKMCKLLTLLTVMFVETGFCQIDTIPFIEGAPPPTSHDFIVIKTR